MPDLAKPGEGILDLGLEVQPPELNILPPRLSFKGTLSKTAGRWCSSASGLRGPRRAASLCGVAPQSSREVIEPTGKLWSQCLENEPGLAALTESDLHGAPGHGSGCRRLTPSSACGLDAVCFVSFCSVYLSLHGHSF